MKRALLLFFLSAFSNQSQASAPFGIPMGTSVEQLKKMGAEYDKDNYWVLKKPPISNNSFDLYMIWTSKKSGVCKVVALGKTINTSEYGHKIRSSFNGLAKVLKNKYGPPAEKFDFLSYDSIWKKDRDFMMGLKLEDRHLTYIWKSTNKSPLPNNISMMLISAKALSSNKGYIRLGYEYKNFSNCTTEQEEKDSTGL